VAGQLNRETGRLLTIVCAEGTAGRGLAVRAEPTSVGISVRALFDCACPVLPGFAAAPAFQF
jgi:hypothetical protein